MITVSAAIITFNNQVLIAQRGENKSLANLWEFPGGKVEENESPEDCVVREIKEELNAKIKVQRYFATNEHHYEFGSIRLIAFLAELESGTISPTEHAAIEWVDISQLKNFQFAPADIPFVEKLEAEGI